MSYTCSGVVRVSVARGAKHNLPPLQKKNPTPSALYTRNFPKVLTLLYITSLMSYGLMKQCIMGNLVVNLPPQTQRPGVNAPLPAPF